MDSHEPPIYQPRPTSFFPSAAIQASYFFSGTLAGTSTLPIEIYYQRPKSLIYFLRINAAAPIYRASFRFWTLGHIKHQCSGSSIPAWLVGAMGGAAGGFVEVGAQSALRGCIPRPSALANQSLKLFLCFGTYTYLSTTLSEELPPKPFWKCWMMGMAAGAVGSGVVAALTGTRGRVLWAGEVPRGAVTIGTVILVHVMSCNVFLKEAERRGYG